VSLDQGKTLRDVLVAFEKAGYRTAFKVLNAAHYGVPQDRWRLVFIGTRLPGVLPSFPLPTHFSYQRPNFTGGRDYTFRHAIGRSEQEDLFNGRELVPPVTVRDAISDLPPIESGGGDAVMKYAGPPRTDYQRLLRKGSVQLWNHECADVAAINLERIQYVKPGGSWRDIPHHLLPKGLQRARRSDHTKRYGRLSPDSLSGTIMTKCDPHWGTFFHYQQDRIISVREAARIQSFPDRFRFVGPKVEQYRQVGNAVPPLLALAIARHIKAILHEEQKPASKVSARNRISAARHG
jgi:DNA (cytosine-5)-methyltransferase 1